MANQRQVTDDKILILFPTLISLILHSRSGIRVIKSGREYSCFFFS
ncbi:Uncharacterized protein dnm_033500 [Desulfonema magnum]|uniref:Uncharacterized protein n=1 Tax=Desulfonema magnum TaxID=45655 RepID=A0A975BKX8_9BACT|nr:Uncharacterized protein dnm_033500 [Desulfonema magnum]